MAGAVTFQRIGSISNAHVGSAFEGIARRCLAGIGLHLDASHKVLIGVGDTKKDHTFDLGCGVQKVIVECKSHRWTTGANIPSAKLTVWNEAMYYFHLAPPDYRKIMFVLKDVCSRRGTTLAGYYLRNHAHLVPADVEFWEYDEADGVAACIRPAGQGI